MDFLLTLQCVTVLSDNPDFRYIVGNDAATILEARSSMSYTEFQGLISLSSTRRYWLHNNKTFNTTVKASSINYS